MVEIETSKIRNGSMDGKCVWIYDLRYRELTGKALRRVLPQKVMVRSNEECSKKIYYSNSHFVGLNKKGEPLKSKIIPLFDNTGFRSNTGDPVKIFDNEKECFESFHKVANALVGRAKSEQIAAAIRYVKLIEEFEGLIRG